ncbi:hypothetical protein FACS1894202_12730 [Clostridia bacterium]|nr:hypothetical protein FACS1894202_12730 [Clostridia bacterium]
MDFSEAIQQIMPLVADGDKRTPFIISRQNDEWIVNYPYLAEKTAEHLASTREKDPYAAQFTGAGFSRGSFPYVYDKVILERLRLEYADRTNGDRQLYALLNVIEDNITAVSHTAMSYITSLDRPLTELNAINPFDLTNADDETAQKLLKVIERYTAERENENENEDEDEELEW